MYNAKQKSIVLIQVGDKIYRGIVAQEQEDVLILEDIENYLGDRADGASSFQKMTFGDRISFNKSLILWLKIEKKFEEQVIQPVETGKKLSGL